MLWKRSGRSVLFLSRSRGSAAEDAGVVDQSGRWLSTQATFLVLVRRAGTLRRCDLLGNWLYGVAYRVATRLRVLAARRMARTASHPGVVEPRAAEEGRLGTGRNPTNDSEPELKPWLHEEISRLPKHYRIPIVLCYFEGLTHAAAATRLGWPLGTVKGRLARARDLLRRRLVRRGVTLSAAALASQLALPDARAAVPASLQCATLKAALAAACTAGASFAVTTAICVPAATRPRQNTRSRESATTNISFSNGKAVTTPSVTRSRSITS
jgi:DNA-directed RNA polymerase specialized sigma24 family protein